MKTRTPLIAAWITFVTGATFFVLMMPLGEGFDELWHFAYIQRVAQLRKVPESHASNLSKEALAFLQLHPVSWAVHNNFPILRSYEEYWRHPENRPSVDEQIANLRFDGAYQEVPNPASASAQYESHQPPLYYFLAAPVFAVCSRYLSFIHTFTAMRFFSVLLASTIVPAMFLLAHAALKDFKRAASAAALLVAFPGLYPSLTRVSNDALVLPLACWTLLSLVRYLEKSTTARLVILQVLVIAGLWTKAFFIPIAAGVVLCLLYAGRFRAAGAVLVLSMLGTPWYVGNFIQSHTVTGLPEEISGTTSTITVVQALSGINWLNLFHVLRASHIWTGNWSFLSVRVWMYQVVFGTYLIGIVGLLRGRLRNPWAITALGICYLVSLAGLVYYAIIEFRYAGASVTEGWYLAPMIPAEIVLFVAGVQSLFGRYQRWALLFAQTSLTLMLVYTAAFIEVPYYAGITAHAPGGQVTTYHPHASDIPLMTARLLRFHRSVPLALPWTLLSAFVVFGVYSSAGNLTAWRTALSSETGSVVE
jgi:hypothetical protein